MKASISKAQEMESSYLAGVEANLKTAGKVFIAGTSPKVKEFDQGEKVRAAMVDRRMYDRDLFASMPHGRGFTIRDQQRHLIFFKRVKRVMVASVIAPPGPLLDSDDAAPVTKATFPVKSTSICLTSMRIFFCFRAMTAPSKKLNDVTARIDQAEFFDQAVIILYYALCNVNPFNGVQSFIPGFQFGGFYR